MGAHLFKDEVSAENDLAGIRGDVAADVQHLRMFEAVRQRNHKDTQRAAGC